MARVFWKCNTGYLFDMMKKYATTMASSTAHTPTSGTPPLDAVFIRASLDMSSNPPDLIIEMDSASTASATGFITPVTARGKADGATFRLP